MPIASISPTPPSSNFKSFRILRHAPRRIALRLPFCRVHNGDQTDAGIRSSRPTDARVAARPAFICKMGRPRVSSGPGNYRECRRITRISANKPRTSYPASGGWGESCWSCLRRVRGVNRHEKSARSEIAFEKNVGTYVVVESWIFNTWPTKQI